MYDGTSMERTPLLRHTNPIIAIVVSVLAVFLAGEAFFLYAKRQQPPPPSVPYADIATNWQTYVNKTEGYAFEYPSMLNGPATIRDDLVEIYEEVEGLVILINTIDVPNDPASWLATQTVDGYSQKPLRCFSKEEVSRIPSVLSSGTTLLTFREPVLFLDNIESAESKQGSCANAPLVRVILMRHNNKLLKITFTGMPVSERVVTSFRFLD